MKDCWVIPKLPGIPKKYLKGLKVQKKCPRHVWGKWRDTPLRKRAGWPSCVWMRLCDNCGKAEVET